MRTLTARFLVAACLAAGWSCYPNQITDASQLASVTTLVDRKVPLDDARTFAMPDTIVHILGGLTDDNITRRGDAAILARVRTELTGFGWRQIADPRAERPDVVVLVAASQQENVGVAYADPWSSWGYYGGWPAGYDASWAWGFPSTAVPFTYETGTLFIAMVDIRHDDPSTRRIPLVWVAGINGILATASLVGVMQGIGQAFTQSPYLERK